MATGTKITLSAKELELVGNTGWILAKHTVINKVYQLLGDAVPAMQQVVKQAGTTLPPWAAQVPPKIYRGENYQLMPYVLLDYPRYFVKDDALAIRTFFWWGHFFSVTLQLSGTCKQQALPGLQAAYSYLACHQWHIVTGNDAWQHSLADSSPVAGISEEVFEALLKDKPFTKLAKKIPVQQWDAVPGFIQKSFSELISLLQNCYAPNL
ncbi:MAG: hypothetical protein RL172_3255 [Bacteroidota bacterium]